MCVRLTVEESRVNDEADEMRARAGRGGDKVWILPTRDVCACASVILWCTCSGSGPAFTKCSSSTRLRSFTAAAWIVQ